MQRYLLLGAGFSRNWGGWLANAPFATIWLGVSMSAPIAAMAAVSGILALELMKMVY
ncbi:hypothetical protein GWC77_03535 [Paraburkholderia sp. NMBU_R16]|uniref:hypothetical protein n=1 Tax=Paraburkholderia sp. NMBU_R16 TaxID=2698676 RepID=UPI0015647976|nr:hypothetical protein [Paraburkholderia sp. NMBU_R16]NRO95014.1 hypothetical protein [Paraburkholderia sp. NMBU_R16]